MHRNLLLVYSVISSLCEELVLLSWIRCRAVVLILPAEIAYATANENHEQREDWTLKDDGWILVDEEQCYSDDGEKGTETVEKPRWLIAGESHIRTVRRWLINDSGTIVFMRIPI